MEALRNSNLEDILEEIVGDISDEFDDDDDTFFTKINDLLIFSTKNTVERLLPGL
jgi:CBS domain containing-hemolysin-like protein